MIRRFSAACLLYHISLPLSRGFSNFFQVFLQTLSDLLSRLSAACVLYHSHFRLSRGFSNFFKFFCLLFAFPLSLGQPVYYIIPPLLCQYLFSRFFIFVHQLQHTICCTLSAPTFSTTPHYIILSITTLSPSRIFSTCRHSFSLIT